MLGTTLCWFLLDIVFYGNGLFNHDVMDRFLSTPTTAASPLQDAYAAALVGMFALPGNTDAHAHTMPH